MCLQPGYSCPQPGCLCHQFMGVGRTHAVCLRIYTHSEKKTQTPRRTLHVYYWFSYRKSERLLLSRSQAQIIFLLLLYERLKAERNFMGLFIRAAPCVVQIFLIATDTAAEFAYCKLFLGC